MLLCHSGCFVTVLSYQSHIICASLLWYNTVIVVGYRFMIYASYSPYQIVLLLTSLVSIFLEEEYTFLSRPFYNCSSCLNGGSCVDGINTYTCSCAAGYTGSNCQHRINPCDSVPCLNGATCSNVDGTYDCHCPFGFTGPRCEVR